MVFATGLGGAGSDLGGAVTGVVFATGVGGDVGVGTGVLLGAAAAAERAAASSRASFGSSKSSSAPAGDGAATARPETSSPAPHVRMPYAAAPWATETKIARILSLARSRHGRKHATIVVSADAPPR